MTEHEALVGLHALEELVAHPGWALVAARWREAEREADGALHRERVDDVVRMQGFQTTCRVLREVLETPEVMMAECRDALG